MATVQDIKDTAEGDSSEFSDTLEVDDSLVSIIRWRFLLPREKHD